MLRARAVLLLACLCACDSKDPMTPITGEQLTTTSPPGPPSTGPLETTDPDPSAPTDTSATSAGEVTTDDPMSTSTGTDPTSGDDTAAGLSHEADILPIWQDNCVAGCHTPGGVSEFTGVILTDDLAYQSLVGVPSPSAPMPLVAPGDPSFSYLMYKLDGTHLDVGGVGNSMPLGESMLPLSDFELIGSWISAGAPP
ncbi:MAG: hypothetical protein JNL82_22635 [Myxococcales bacterium]|nr:hypothetical protein [Myxococcales bacterium]